MKFLKIAATLAFGILAPSAFAASICPTLSGTSGTYQFLGGGCNDLIKISATNVVSVTTVGQNPVPFDGSDDQIIGVQNNSSSAITSLTLTGSGIFGFDGDGIVGLGGTGNVQDTSGYGGPNAFFSNIVGNTGVVNFIVPIAANGGTSYFSLEEAPSAGGFTGTVGGQVPEPSSLILLGTGAVGLATRIRRRFVS